MPEGEVVFLMTDIVGSSALAEQDPGLYIETLGTHDEVVALAVNDCDGHLLKHRGEGDSTFSVFRSADAALDCAKRIHRELAARNTIVRSGLNRGIAHFAENDYLGDVVNRCARIRGLANPGQVLLSDTVKNAAQREHDLIYHGLQTLRGMINGAQIYELRVEASTESLDLTTDSRRPLPKLYDRFVGRDADLALAKQMLGAYRVLTLHGPGGVGKTRLSIEVASQMTGHFPGGIEFFDLSQSDSASFLSVLPSIDAICKPNAQSQLLVLDNCEQIVEQVGAWITQVIQATSTIKIMATSQIALEVVGEYVQRLEPLNASTATSHATELLICRAMEKGTPSSVIEPQRTVIAEIASRLGGMPLAIELVAGKLKSVPATRILSSLDGLLARDFGENSTSRWGSLSELCRYSLSLLSPADYRLAQAASVLGTTFCYDAISALPAAFVRDEFEASESLDRLVRHSIISAVWARAGVVYKMSDLFRKELAGTVSPEEQSEIVESHAQWAELTAATALASEAAYHEIRPFLDDMVFAINRSLELGNRQRALGLFRAARKSWIADEVSVPALSMADRLLDMYPDVTEERAELLNVRGIFLVHQDANALGKKAYRESMEAYQYLGNRQRVAVLRHNLGILYYYEHDYDSAQSMLESCLIDAKELRDDGLVASVIVHLIVVRYGDNDEASAKIYESQLTDYGLAMTPLLNGVWMNAKIHFLLIRERVEETIPLLRRMIVEGAGLNDIAMLARAVLFLSAVHHSTGRAAEARELLGLCRAFIRDRSVHFFVQDHALLQVMIQSLGDRATEGEVVPGLESSIYTKLSSWAVENTIKV